MALSVRKDYYQCTHRLDTTQIYRTSRMVSELMSMPVQPNKAVVGANAFAHSSGLHQDGMLKDRQTYEIMTPESVGMPGSRIVLGKTSGRHAFRDAVEKMGFHLNTEEFERAFSKFKELADKKRHITQRDVEAILVSEARQAATKEVYRLDLVQVTCGDKGIPTATVRLVDSNGKVLQDAALGDGPVDAVCKAINRIVKVPTTLTEFHVQAVTEGIDAQGEVSVRVQRGNTSLSGYGVDTDIIVASAKAYMNALNKLLAASGPQPGEERPETAATQQAGG